MSTGHFVGVSYHRQLLRDRVRTQAYERAIAALVRPGDVVLDVGAGTGILSLFAARAGARRVFAVESTPHARIARRVVADNDLADVIEVFEADAREVELPEPADVLITECMGNFVLSDAMLGVLAGCRRLLAAGARVCPAEVRVRLAPVNAAPFMGHISWWSEPRYGFDLSAARHSAENDVTALQLPPALLVAPPLTYATVPITAPPPEDWRREVSWGFPEGATVTGVAGWFEAQLSDDVVLDTAPGIDTHWGQVLFPLPPHRLDPGDRLTFSLSVALGLEDMPCYHWSGAFTDAAGDHPSAFDLGQDLRF